MNANSYFWADLSTTDFQARLRSGLAAQTVAVLPVAAIEQHGPHLAVSVDATLVDGIVAACLPQLPTDAPVLVLPTQQVGYSPEHASFPGTLSLSAGTVMDTWIELGQCVARAGVKKLLIFNAHGGQVSLLDIVGRELRGRSQMLVYSASWFNLPLDAAATAQFSAEEHRFGIHAGAIETSMMLALRPAGVDMALAQSFPSSSQQRAAQFPILGNGRSAKLAWHMQDYNPAGAVGDASQASAAKGAALVASAAQQLALLLQELLALPLTTLATDHD